jgi:hypothetical protein
MINVTVHPFLDIPTRLSYMYVSLIVQYAPAWTQDRDVRLEILVKRLPSLENLFDECRRLEKINPHTEALF